MRAFYHGGERRSTLIERSGRGASQPPLHYRLGGRRRRGVTGDRGQEVVALERVKARVGDRGHRRGPRNVAQERDLSEGVTRTGERAAAAVGLDLELALGEDVEAVAHVAGADHGPPRRDVHLDERLRDV